METLTTFKATEWETVKTNSLSKKGSSEMIYFNPM